MVVRKSFLGMSITEWVALISIFGFGAGAYAMISSRISVAEYSVSKIDEKQKEQDATNKSVYNSISEIKGDVKEVNGKLDILINRK